MAKSQLEVLFIDESTGLPPEAGGTGTSPAPPAPRPSEPIQGPPARRSSPDAAGPESTTEVKGPPKRRESDVDPVIKAAERLSGRLTGLIDDATGLGRTFSTLKSLADDFRDLFRAVMKSRPEPAVAATRTGARASSFEGPPAAASHTELPQPTASIPAGPPRSLPVVGGSGTPPVRATAATVPGPMAIGARGAGAAGGAEAAGTAASAMSRMATAAAPVAAGFIAITAAASPVLITLYALKKSFDILGPQVERLAGMSPEVGAASAESDFRSEMAEFRRAQRIGPGLASVERIRSRGEEALTDLGTELLALLTRFVEQAEPSINLLIDFLKIATPAIPAVVEAIVFIQSTLALDFKERQNALIKLAFHLVAVRVAIENIGKDDADPIGDDPHLAAFFTSIEGAAASLPPEFRPAKPRGFPGGELPDGELP